MTKYDSSREMMDVQQATPSTVQKELARRRATSSELPPKTWYTDMLWAERLCKEHAELDSEYCSCEKDNDGSTTHAQHIALAALASFRTGGIS